MIRMVSLSSVNPAMKFVGHKTYPGTKTVCTVTRPALAPTPGKFTRRGPSPERNAVLSRAGRVSPP